jgi:hypothetical protein
VAGRLCDRTAKRSAVFPPYSFKFHTHRQDYESTSELSLLLEGGKEKNRSEMKTHDETREFFLSAVLTPN